MEELSLRVQYKIRPAVQNSVMLLPLRANPLLDLIPSRNSWSVRAGFLLLRGQPLPTTPFEYQSLGIPRSPSGSAARVSSKMPRPGRIVLPRIGNDDVHSGFGGDFCKP